MSLVSDAMKAGLSALQSACGQTLYYRQTATDSWAVLTGAFLQPSAPQFVGYDDNRQAIMVPMSARLKVPTDGVRLVAGANGVSGAQVKDQTDTVWAVLGPAHSNGQSIYVLGRAPVQALGPAKGGTP